MSEMLGNQYFLARNFSLAISEFEQSLVNHPENLSVNKKLVLCYLKTGQINSATDALLKILTVNPDIILLTDAKNDDCPCNEIIEEIKNKPESVLDGETKMFALGILWLYCDVQKALELFDQIPESSKYNITINKVIKSINIFN